MPVAPRHYNSVGSRPSTPRPSTRPCGKASCNTTTSPNNSAPRFAAGGLASTYLFVGPEGIGKRRFALALAKALLCPNTAADPLEPCGHCESCRLFDAGNHPDLDVVSLPKDKSTLPLDLFIGDKDHRNQDGLCHRISLRPFLGGRKIAIIDDADHFSAESANCLLKTLEEPPPRSLLILIGTSPSRQLPTIRSRSQVVRFRPLSSRGRRRNPPAKQSGRRSRPSRGARVPRRRQRLAGPRARRPDSLGISRNARSANSTPARPIPCEWPAPSRLSSTKRAKRHPTVATGCAPSSLLRKITSADCSDPTSTIAGDDDVATGHIRHTCVERSCHFDT